MQLTKEQKIYFCKNAITFFQEYELSSAGICNRLFNYLTKELHCTNDFDNISYLNIIHDFLPELNAKKPDTYCDYWFELSPSGHAQRVKLLTEVLNELQQ